MNKIKKKYSLKLNFIMNLLLTTSNFIYPLLTFPYISRILLPEGVGKVSFATSFISYFSMFAQLGIPTYGIRVCAKVRDNRAELTKTVQELLIINLIMCIFSYIVLGFALIYVPRVKEERMLYIVLSSTILLTSIGMEWLYKALEQYTYITVRSIIFKTIALFATFMLIHDSDDYIIYGGLTIFAASASNIFNAINAHKYIDFKTIKKYDICKHIKAIFVFFAMTCATTIYTNLDTVMLGFMKTDIDVGYYNAAVRIKNILVGIVTSLGTVLLPRASYYVEKGLMAEFHVITSKAIDFIFLLATPLVIFFILFAKEGIYFLAGEKYTSSIIPMQVIMPTLLFIGLTNIFGIQILVPTGREIYVLYSEIAGAVADVLVNWLLITRYSSVGAAIGTLVAEFIVFCVQLWVLRNEILDTLRNVMFFEICIGIIIACLCSLWIKILPIGNFGVLILAAMVFFLVYFAFLLCKKEKILIEVYQQVINKIKNKE